jgi:3-oxoacyl-[acyl-carrier-protein] synthase-3
MGASIEGVGSVRAAGWRRPSFVGLAARAARRALRAAGRAPGEIDLLIYAGVYRDLAEPALAPFLQRRLGINPGPKGSSRRTHSFDVANGSCGMVTAMQVADGYLRTGAVGHALVVASDADPTPGVSRGCSFEPSASAFVLGPGSDLHGFEAFRCESFEKGSNLFQGRVDWIGAGRSRLARRLRANHALRIETDDRYVAQCAECAALTLEGFLRERGVASGEPDLIVPSLAPAGFPTAFAERLGGDPRVLVTGGGLRPHSAGPGFALEAALEPARELRARSLVLVAAGAGISVGVALYRLPDSAGRWPATLAGGPG